MLAVVLVVAGCGGSTGGRHNVRVSAIPATALYDTAFTTTVTGLRSGERVTLKLASTSKDGTAWSSSAQFAADGHGTFSTTQAPLPGGSYAAADPMGLVETLTPGHLDAAFTPPTPWTMTESVHDGAHTLASTTVTRQSPTAVGVTHVDERPNTTGIYGELFTPRSAPTSPVPAVVAFGGSEGGLSSATGAATLAAHGYPALALAYFHEPGLPADLERIPLAYFATAVALLARQPGVDPHRIVLWGTSRGSEAALLTAVRYPQLVHAVIASVPSAEAVSGLPDQSVAAWTFHGADVATAPPEDFRNQSATSPAAIPVEQVDGPILLVCGVQDEVWASCPNSNVIAERLQAHHRPAPILLSYPAAGHFVGGLLPYLPSTIISGTTASGLTTDSGGTYAANQAGRAQAWPRVLAFIHTLTD
jgi:dienelactone hydrolase